MLLDDIYYHFAPPLDLVSEDAHMIIDLGCNDGSTTLFYAEQYPDATIIGVELDRHVADLASERVEKYRDRVFIVNEAIGWPEGEHVAYIDSCSAVSTLTPYQGRMTTTVTVDVISLDTFLVVYDLDEPIDFMKIDIEGAETSLLNTTKWLELVKVFIVECHTDEAIETFLNLDGFTVRPLFSNPKYKNHLLAINDSAKI